MVDDALLRPGRFDRHIHIGNPDAKSRLAILENGFKNKPLSDEINLQQIANNCENFSGAMLAGIVTEASMLAVRDAVEGIASHQNSDDGAAEIDQITLLTQINANVIKPIHIKSALSKIKKQYNREK